MSSTGIYKRLKAILPSDPLLSGEVELVHADGTATVVLHGTGRLRVRNPLAAIQGAIVYVQGGAITGPAPDLPYVLIEV